MAYSEEANQLTVPAQPVDTTPPDINFFRKGGVHDAQTLEAVFGPAGRFMEKKASHQRKLSKLSQTGKVRTVASTAELSEDATRKRFRPSGAICLAILGFGILLPQAQQWEVPRLVAHAIMVSPVATPLGIATFTEGAAGVQLNLHVIQQVPGRHALYLLSRGDCEGPEFKLAGVPFNPDGKDHNAGNAFGPNLGDLPDFEAGLDGKAAVSITVKGVTLSPGLTSLLRPGGTVLVIDENPAILTSGSRQNSGPHVACGEIERGAGPSFDSVLEGLPD